MIEWMIDKKEYFYMIWLDLPVKLISLEDSDRAYNKLKNKTNVLLHYFTSSYHHPVLSTLWSYILVLYVIQTPHFIVIVPTLNSHKCFKGALKIYISLYIYIDI